MIGTDCLDAAATIWRAEDDFISAGDSHERSACGIGQKPVRRLGRFARTEIARVLLTMRRAQNFYEG